MLNKTPNIFKEYTVKFSVSLILCAQAFINLYSQTESITDLEGNVYQTVLIGDQRWMAENLRVTKYANGDEIPHLTNISDWANTDGGAYCFYENKTDFIGVYGNLYNWYTVEDDRGVCPAGWHVPSDEDWIKLEMYLGMSAEESQRMTAWRGTDEGDKIKSESFGGNNSSGFTALGTGYRDPAGVFKGMGTDNDYWTSTPYDNEGNTEGVLHGFLNSRSDAVRNFHVPGYGFCIRCVDDNQVQVEHHQENPNSTIFPNPAENHLFIKNAIGNHLTIQNLNDQLKTTLHVPSLNLSIYQRTALVSTSLGLL